MSIEFHPRPSSDLLDYVRAVSSRVLALRKRHRFVGVVGHSMGGLIAASLDAEANKAADGICTIAAPLLPGVSMGPLTPFVAKSIQQLCKSLARKGHYFDGIQMSSFMRRFQALFDSDLLASMPFRIWQPHRVNENILTQALNTSFRVDTFSVFGDFVELRSTNGETAGRLKVGRRLRAMTSPLLTIAGDSDRLAPLESTRALYERAGSVDKSFSVFGKSQSGSPTGHLDLLIGKDVDEWVLPKVLHYFKELRLD